MRRARKKTNGFSSFFHGLKWAEVLFSFARASARTSCFCSVQDGLCSRGLVFWRVFEMIDSCTRYHSFKATWKWNCLFNDRNIVDLKPWKFIELGLFLVLFLFLKIWKYFSFTYMLSAKYFPCFMVLSVRFVYHNINNIKEQPTTVNWMYEWFKNALFQMSSKVKTSCTSAIVSIVRVPVINARN